MEEKSNSPWFERRKECPVCASGRFKTIYQIQYSESPIRDFLLNLYLPQGMVEFEYLDKATYVLCECDICGLIFQRDIPNEILTERLYEHWIDPKKAFSKYQKQDAGYYSYYKQEVMKIISYFKKEPSSLSLLDFGMGWGNWTQIAKDIGCDIYGTELSADRMEYARSNGIKAITWDEIPQYRFDFINTEQVFEHLSEPLKTLQYLKSALKTEGILKVSVPTANNIRDRLKIMDWKAPRGTRNSLIPVAPLEHINFFTRKSLLKMAEEAGMKEVVIPMRLHYKYITLCWGTKWIFKSLLYPLTWNILKSKNYVFFRNV
jgi:2-polyprenyl-3-methyl-5-hydroxy-6-metoxy-1,4-benzoquinol methylase